MPSSTAVPSADNRARHLESPVPTAAAVLARRRTNPPVGCGDTGPSGRLENRSNEISAVLSVEVVHGHSAAPAPRRICLLRAMRFPHPSVLPNQRRCNPLVRISVSGGRAAPIDIDPASLRHVTMTT